MNSTDYPDLKPDMITLKPELIFEDKMEMCGSNQNCAPSSAVDDGSPEYKHYMKSELIHDDIRNCALFSGTTFITESPNFADNCDEAINKKKKEVENNDPSAEVQHQVLRSSLQPKIPVLVLKRCDVDSASGSSHPIPIPKFERENLELETPLRNPGFNQQKQKSMSNPMYLKPFDFGWKREVVYRVKNNGKHQCDVYYCAPMNKKVRSRKELQKHIARTKLSLKHFTFYHAPLGVNDSSKEIIRSARVKGSKEFTESSAPKGVSKSKTKVVTKGTAKREMVRANKKPCEPSPFTLRKSQSNKGIRRTTNLSISTEMNLKRTDQKAVKGLNFAETKTAGVSQKPTFDKKINPDKSSNLSPSNEKVVAGKLVVNNVPNVEIASDLASPTAVQQENNDSVSSISSNVLNSKQTKAKVGSNERERVTCNQNDQEDDGSNVDLASKPALVTTEAQLSNETEIIVNGEEQNINPENQRNQSAACLQKSAEVTQENAVVEGRKDDDRSVDFAGESALLASSEAPCLNETEITTIVELVGLKEGNFSPENLRNQSPACCSKSAEIKQDNPQESPQQPIKALKPVNAEAQAAQKILWPDGLEIHTVSPWVFDEISLSTVAESNSSELNDGIMNKKESSTSNVQIMELLPSVVAESNSSESNDGIMNVSESCTCNAQIMEILPSAVAESNLSESSDGITNKCESSCKVQIMEILQSAAAESNLCELIDGIINKNELCNAEMIKLLLSAVVECNLSELESNDGITKKSKSSDAQMMEVLPSAVAESNLGESKSNDGIMKKNESSNGQVMEIFASNESASETDESKNNALNANFFNLPNSKPIETSVSGYVGESSVLNPVNLKDCTRSPGKGAVKDIVRVNELLTKESTAVSPPKVALISESKAISAASVSVHSSDTSFLLKPLIESARELQVRLIRLKTDATVTASNLWKSKCTEDPIMEIQLTETASTSKQYLTSSLSYSSSKSHCVELSTGKLFSCKQCPAKFHSKRGLNDHEIIHYNDERSLCTLCSAWFKRKFHVKQHLLTHSNEKDFYCNQCSATFKCESYLRLHLLTHTVEKAYSCNHCSVRFKKKSHLRRHLLFIHSDAKTIICDQCSAVFKCNYSLRDRLKTHSNKRAFSCDQCSALFKRNYSLRDRLKTHSNKKAFSCDQCSARFKREDDLPERLLSLHSNLCPFSCDPCSVTFKFKSHLQSHMLTHRSRGPGVSPFGRNF